MANPLLVEDGVLDNGETYQIRRLRPFNAEEEYPYRLYLDTGDIEAGDVELFRTMTRAQAWMDGYAKGKGTFIRIRNRINA